MFADPVNASKTILLNVLTHVQRPVSTTWIEARTADANLMPNVEKVTFFCSMTDKT